MQIIATLKKSLKFEFFINIFKIFEPILTYLAIPNSEYESWQNNIQNFNDFSNQDLNLNKILKFQNFFKNLLLNAFIQDSLKVYDLIRELFLYKIANKSSNCLKDCEDVHGCCHGNYSVDLIDYYRIISENLFPSENFQYKNCRYRIKLKKAGGDLVCSAFDMNSRLCLIHKYKPATCCKYPLISNIFIWDGEQKEWSGKCAHGGIWTTSISPNILQGISKLWIKSSLLWEKEQDFIKKYDLRLKLNELCIGKKILTINSNKIRHRNSIINLLSEDFSKNDVARVLNMIKF